MKYMIMTFGETSALEGKSEWINEMIEFMRRIDVELTESGELVFQQGSPTEPGQDGQGPKGVPVATDGHSPSLGSPWWGSGSWTSRARPGGRDRRAYQPGG
jgi:hypothetical protein